MEFKPYDPKAIEPKWQKRWADSHVFEAKNDYTMPKFYGLIEFPYPSGQGPVSYTHLTLPTKLEV